MKPMRVIKVDARANKQATFNDVMSKCNSNVAYETMQKEMKKGGYSTKKVKQLCED